MAGDPELLTTTEAAFVADVSVRDVNRLIDEHILPPQLYRIDGSRRVYAGACALLNFYVVTAKSLTARERNDTIQKLWSESKAKHAFWTIKQWRRSRPKWAVHRHPFLTINFDGFVSGTIERHDKLAAARQMVVEDPGILGGMPVIKGTRVPVHDVAASANAGLPIDRLKDAYPNLDERQFELAILYAKAIPARGRPRAIKPDAPAAAVRKVVRRRMA
jgi:uncharacterized protein (DUF433 family)